MVFLIEVFKTEKKDLEMSRLSNLISHHFFFFFASFAARIFSKHERNEHNQCVL